MSFSNILISFRNIFLERIFDYFGYKCLKLHKERIKYWHWYLVTSKWCSFDVFDVIFILTIHLKELSPADNICFKVNCFFFGKWSTLFQTTILFPLSIFSYIPIVVWNRPQYCWIYSVKTGWNHLTKLGDVSEVRYGLSLPSITHFNTYISNVLNCLHIYKQYFFLV